MSTVSYRRPRRMPLRAPFPWPGSKASVAVMIWERFGIVHNYVEPFAGSLAVLLARPAHNMGGLETVCDTDGLLVNFYRAIRYNPDKVAEHADWPTTQIDLAARKHWLRAVAPAIRANLEADPEWHDPRAAGWWAWLVCNSIGPVILEKASGRPHLGRPNGYMGRRHQLPAAFEALARRLSETRIVCGDWTSVLTPVATTYHAGVTAVFLDPPYSHSARSFGLYQCDSRDVAQQVAQWARENGDNPRLRICLAGYEGEYGDLPGWDCMSWTSSGGYCRYSGDPAKTVRNRSRERLWFSPWCCRPSSVDEEKSDEREIGVPANG